MTSFHELLSTRDVPVVARAPKRRSWVALAWARSFVAAAAQTVLTIAVLFGLLATVPAAFGQITSTVMSDSMAPGLHAGDVVIVRPMTVKQVKVGQVVLVDDPTIAGRLRLHRLVAVENDRLVLKGDANRSNDGTPVDGHDLHGAGWLRVPWIGLPVFWLRSGDLAPLGLSFLAVLAVAAIAASDRSDGGGPRGGSRTRRPTRATRLAVRARRILSARSTRTAGALSLVLIIAVAVSTIHPQAAAAFNSVTTSPGNSVGTGSFDCPTRPVAPTSTVLYYSYMTASGATEPDVGGNTTAQPGTLGTGATRVSGNCSGNASPSVSVDSTANGFVASNSAMTAPTNYTISLWFKAVTNTGVLASLGTTKTAAPTGPGDRQIYFTGGKLSFAMLRPGNPMASCSIATTPTTGVWHLAVATFASTGTLMTLYLDNSTTSCTANDNNVSNSPGYWRFGGDSPLDTSATNSFAGELDETAVYSGVVSAAGVDTIYGAGH